MRHRNRKASRSLVALVALVVTAAAAAAATAGDGGHATKQAKRMTSLQHQVAALKAQNKRLTQYTPSAIARQLAGVKAALDKYESVDAAKADGYSAASPCESTATAAEASWWGGGMGIHYVNPALMTLPHIEPSKPPILTYLPTASGMKLLAAEYFKADADQDVKTDADRPSLFGRAFDGPMLGHAPGMPIHYDLHVWLWEHNPSGLFASFNPDVTCG